MDSLSVTATISTLDRYSTTLPLALLGIIGQTIKPKKFILFDDGHTTDLREHPVFSHIFCLFEQKNIEWKVIQGLKQGQTANHQRALDTSTTDFIWRLDDDSIAEPNVLETLLQCMQNDGAVGAAGCLVLNPKRHYSVPSERPYNKIENIFNTPNIQWCEQHATIHQVDHLYSTFLFRVKAASHGYCKDLSIVGHREETIFTYEMKRAGWDVVVDTSARVWDMQQPAGGTRLFDHREDLFEHNERVFKRKILEWGGE